MTSEQQDEFLEHMRNGMRRGAAAEALGLTRMAALAFIAQEHEFRARVEDAEGLATEHVEEALYHAAVSGSVPAAKIWLDLRKPKAPMLPAVIGDEQVVSEATSEDELEALLRLTTE
jgi:hypothetical protein